MRLPLSAVFLLAVNFMGCAIFAPAATFQTQRLKSVTKVAVIGYSAVTQGDGFDVSTKRGSGVVQEFGVACYTDFAEKLAKQTSWTIVPVATVTGNAAYAQLQSTTSAGAAGAFSMMNRATGGIAYNLDKMMSDGQVRNLSREQLSSIAKALGVDAVLSVDVQVSERSGMGIGPYAAKSYAGAAKLQMYDAQTGESIWNDPKASGAKGDVKSHSVGIFGNSKHGAYIAAIKNAHDKLLERYAVGTAQPTAAK